MGTLRDYVPSKPRLKNTNKNKMFLKYQGIMPSRQFVVPEVLEEYFSNIREEFDKEVEENIFMLQDDEYWEGLARKKVPKRFTKVLNTHLDLLRMYERKDSLFISNKDHKVDMTLEFFKQLGEGSYDKKGDIEIHDVMKNKKGKGWFKTLEDENWLKEKYPDEYIIEDIPNAQWIDHRLVSSMEMKQAMLIKEIYEECGWNFLTIKGKNLNEKQIRFIKSTTDIEEHAPMDPKELKKWKKKMKKKEKENKKKLKYMNENDEEVASILFQNRIGKSALSTMMSDIKRR
jgi:hypothetical protein